VVASKITLNAQLASISTRYQTIVNAFPNLAHKITYGILTLANASALIPHVI
jgi:hypothetical protein